MNELDLCPIYAIRVVYLCGPDDVLSKSIVMIAPVPGLDMVGLVLCFVLSCLQDTLYPPPLYPTPSQVVAAVV